MLMLSVGGAYAEQFALKDYHLVGGKYNIYVLNHLA